MPQYLVRRRKIAVTHEIVQLTADNEDEARRLASNGGGMLAIADSIQANYFVEEIDEIPSIDETTLPPPRNTGFSFDFSNEELEDFQRTRRERYEREASRAAFDGRGPYSQALQAYAEQDARVTREVIDNWPAATQPWPTPARPDGEDDSRVIDPLAERDGDA